MSSCARAAWILAFLLTAVPFAFAQNATEAVYVVTYIEVAPASLGPATALLRQYRESGRRHTGNLRLEALQQRDRGNHFALLETWKDQKALDAHRPAADVTRFRDALQPLLVAPPDERPLKGFSLGSPPSIPSGASSIYVLTHADALPPPGKGADLLKALAEASRGEAGNVRFEILQQANRQNHFTVVEVWASAKAAEAHALAQHTRAFRGEFQMITGSLYDERLYGSIR